MTDFKLNNGDKVKSLSTGFKGVITARADHLHGCNRYFIQPSVDKDGNIPDAYWMDEDDLKVTKEKAVNPGRNDRGGPISAIK